LYIDGKGNTSAIHQLVANTFIDNPNNKSCVDHIDNDKLNNNINNLRWVTTSENGMNCPVRKSNASGIKGIYYNKSNKNWCAQIQINGIRKHIGSFNTMTEAKIARQKEADILFGEFKNKCEC